jgi:TolB-like protein
VLPFANLSADQENAFFTEGMQDDILTALAEVADLKVISRASVSSYIAGPHRNLRDIGHELGVGQVLEGSVRRAGDRVRVTVQLIDTRTNTHVWAETYDRNLADVFAIQTEIAQQIATQLQAKLSPTEKSAIEERPTDDLAAYDLYLRAKALWSGWTSNIKSRENLLEVASVLNQAVARDPDFFLAYCHLARTHDALYFSEGDRTPARLALAETAIAAAARLRPNSGRSIWCGRSISTAVIWIMMGPGPNLPSPSARYPITRRFSD